MTAAAGTQYPARLHALSATAQVWVRLSVADLLALRPAPRGFAGQGVYFHLNHPIRYVRLVGVVVARTAYASRTILALDDGSGATVEVVWWGPPDGLEGDGIDLEIDVGACVKAKGTIGEWAGARQLLLKRLQRVRSTREEVRCWRQTTDFRAGVLSRVWVVSEPQRVAFEEKLQRARRREERRRARARKQERTA